MKFQLQSILVILFVVTSVVAQDSTSKSSYVLVGFHPLSAFHSLLKLGVEYRPAGHWSFELTPQIAYTSKLNDFEHYVIEPNKDSLSFLTLGAGVSLKYFVFNQLQVGTKSHHINSNFYIFTSAEYLASTVEYATRYWINYIENGNIYYRLQNVTQKNYIKQYGASLGFGSVVTLGDQIFVDAFVAYKAVLSSQNPLYIENQPYADDYFTKNSLALGFGCRVGLLF